MTGDHQLGLDLGQAVPETPRERAMRLTDGRGWMPLDEALDHAMPGWRRTGVVFRKPEPPPRKAKR